MLRFHKEGRATIAITGALIAAMIYLLGSVNQWWSLLLTVAAVILFGVILYFFRLPNRMVGQPNSTEILAPADGKVVVIEEVNEEEFFDQKCLQVSIFMSPLNVHVNWNPINAQVIYRKHHHGKYLVAWHPKSSLENERTTMVYKTKGGTQILVRQIAGAMARRIVNYLNEGDQVMQGSEMGFIKFGSRLDLLIPSDVKLHVKLGQKCIGNRTVIAEL